MEGGTLWAAFIGAAVAALGNMLVWFLFRRPMDQWRDETAQLTTEVHSLRDQRIVRIEKDLRDHAECNEKAFAAESAARKTIYERIEAAVVDLAHVSERLSSVMSRVEVTTERQIALGEDLAKIQGELRRG